MEQGFVTMMAMIICLWLIWIWWHLCIIDLGVQMFMQKEAHPWFSLAFSGVNQLVVTLIVLSWFTIAGFLFSLAGFIPALPIYFITRYFLMSTAVETSPHLESGDKT